MIDFCTPRPRRNIIDLPASPDLLPAVPRGGIKAILLSRAHISIRHQAARPPAGVSNKLQTLAGSHNIACKLHAITKDFQSSREAPKPHFPSFATLPSENLDFHQKRYFYLHGGGQQPPWIPPTWGLPKPWKFKEISFWGTLGCRSRSEAAFEGTRSALERPRVTKGGHPSG